MVAVEIVVAEGIGEVAAIADLYPSKTADEKQRMFRESLASEFEVSQEGQRTILLARLNGVVVGTVQVVWEDSSAAPDLLPAAAAMIHHLRTHPDYRRQGIGQRLVGAAERLARARGPWLLTLGVEPDNLVARRLYAKWGFREFLSYWGQEGEPIVGMTKGLEANRIRF